MWTCTFVTNKWFVVDYVDGFSYNDTWYANVMEIAFRVIHTHTQTEEMFSADFSCIVVSDVRYVAMKFFLSFRETLSSVNGDTPF